MICHTVVQYDIMQCIIMEIPPFGVGRNAAEAVVDAAAAAAMAARAAWAAAAAGSQA